jgi:hypothetical protein
MQRPVDITRDADTMVYPRTICKDCIVGVFRVSTHPSQTSMNITYI